MQEKQFEPKIAEQKYPELEDLVDVELSEDVKSKIAGLVFKGQSEQIADLLQDGKDKELINTEEYQDSIVDTVVDNVKPQNIKAVYTAIISYIDKNIMPILEEKLTELSKRAIGNESKMKEITDWHNKAIRETNELLNKWLPEIMALAWEYEIKMNRENENNINM